MTFACVAVEHEQGREPARHHRDDRGDGRRRLRRAPPLQRRTAAHRRVDERERHQRRRRLARAPDPGACSTPTRCARRWPAPAASTGCTSPSSATSSTAGWPAAPCRRSACSAPTSPSSRHPRCCRRHWRTVRRRRQPTISTPCSRDIDVLYLLRMQQERMNEALVPTLREYTTRFGLTPERAARLGPHDAGHAPRADEPRRRDRRRSRRTARRGHHPTGHQRRRRAHGGAVRPARLGLESTLPMQQRRNRR